MMIPYILLTASDNQWRRSVTPMMNIKLQHTAGNKRQRKATNEIPLPILYNPQQYDWNLLTYVNYVKATNILKTIY